MTIFYGIGTGPGDRELMTVKGARVLGELEILYTPEAKKGGESLAMSIVAGYLKEDLLIKQRHFPMTTNLEEKEASWDAIAKEILSDVRGGAKVGFVTLGDPMIYSTYVYLLERLQGKIDTETIPGIASFVSMAANVQVPLCIDEETFVVIPATSSYETIKKSIEDNDTIVLMKVANHLGKVLPLLKEKNLLEQTILISHASQEQERQEFGIETLRETDKLSYFSTMIVYKNRDIASLRKRRRERLETET